jgi:hypothetical protein
MSDPRASLDLMGSVIDLGRWREDRAEGSLLEGAVDRLGRALPQGRRDRVPDWVATELLAIHGCLSLGSEDEAVRRIQLLTARLERGEHLVAR